MSPTPHYPLKVGGMEGVSFFVIRRTLNIPSQFGDKVAWFLTFAWDIYNAKCGLSSCFEVERKRGSGEEAESTGVKNIWLLPMDQIVEPALDYLSPVWCNFSEGKKKPRKKKKSWKMHYEKRTKWEWDSFTLFKEMQLEKCQRQKEKESLPDHQTSTSQFRTFLLPLSILLSHAPQVCFCSVLEEVRKYRWWNGKKE